MNPAQLLKSILQGRRPSVSRATVSHVVGGTVYLIENGRTRAATTLPGDASTYLSGDEVRVENGVLIGKTSVRRSKVFYL